MQDKVTQSLIVVFYIVSFFGLISVGYSVYHWGRLDQQMHCIKHNCIHNHD